MTTSPRPRRVVVTGGAGRLGRSVVSALAAAGDDVVSIDIERVADLPAEQVVVDLRDLAATVRAFGDAGADGVVHLAGIAVPFSAPEATIYATNTSIMGNVLEATGRSNARTLLVASSPTVVGYGNPNGWMPRYLPIDEGHPVAPWHAYAASKQAMEQLVAMAVRRDGARLRLGVFRPCYVIAPEEWRGAPTQQGHTVRERLDDPGLSAGALFNYIDARDAADFVLAWVRTERPVPNGTCFFVGAADALATAPSGELVARHLGTPAEMAAGLAERDALFDCSLAGRLLGWRARRSWRSELVAAEPVGKDQ